MTHIWLRTTYDSMHFNHILYALHIHDIKNKYLTGSYGDKWILKFKRQKCSNIWHITCGNSLSSIWPHLKTKNSVGSKILLQKPWAFILLMKFLNSCHSVLQLLTSMSSSLSKLLSCSITVSYFYINGKMWKQSQKECSFRCY